MTYPSSCHLNGIIRVYMVPFRTSWDGLVQSPFYKRGNFKSLMLSHLNVKKRKPWRITGDFYCWITHSPNPQKGISYLSIRNDIKNVKYLMKPFSPMIFVTSVISASSTYINFLVRDNHCFLILSCVISSPAATAASEWFQAMTSSHLQFTRNCYVHTLSTEKQHLHSFAVLVIAVVAVEKSELDNEEYRVFAQDVANIKF